MALCRYCRQSVGWLRHQHRACQVIHERGMTDLRQLAMRAASGEASLDTLDDQLTEIARRSYLTPAQTQHALIAGWEAAVHAMLEDGTLTRDAEATLIAFCERVTLTRDDLNHRAIYAQFVKAAVLLDLMEGRIPQRIELDAPLPFNMQKTEQLLWVFPQTHYYEDKTRRHYVGGSQGVSMRIAKGIYYRVGAFRGAPVETTERLYIGTGIFAVTTKHVYFGGMPTSFRIRYDKIVSFIPLTDGVGLQRDATTAKPQFFLTGDGWFTYNLLANIGHL